MTILQPAKLIGWNFKSEYLTAAKKPTMVMSLVADPRTEAAQEDYFLLARSPFQM